jgi:dynein heavy chain 1
MLSAVSQQIQVIQEGLRQIVSEDAQGEINLLNRPLKLRPDTAMFVTMNPGYAGRSNLPDNLKKLFRPIAMTKPDRELIAQVMLFTQGFRKAELLASKIVPLFVLCSEQLSVQSHYDFGLRALKSVLAAAGNIKRDRLKGESLSSDSGHTRAINRKQLTFVAISEQEILTQSIRETVEPKLIADDIPLLSSLLEDVFPSIQHTSADVGKLTDAIKSICQERRLVSDDNWVRKLLQLVCSHGYMDLMNCPLYLPLVSYPTYPPWFDAGGSIWYW